MRKLSIALALVGLAAGTALIASSGFGNVTGAVASIGWGGFVLVCLWQLVIFLPLGIGWAQLGMARRTGRSWMFVWARMVRDSSANILPFSQLGGFVCGVRALTLHGIAWPTATGLLVVDLTAEFLAQIAFVVFGLVLLLSRRASGLALIVPASIGLGLALLGIGVFVMLQHRGGSLFERVAERIASGRWHDARQKAAALHAELTALYRHPVRLLVCFLLHCTGWLCSGLADWIAFRLIGVRIGVPQAVAIEALLSGVASFAFLVPVSVGVQEASYAGFGALFGVPPEMSLAVALIRRARDLACGAPVLLIWQFVELRRLRGTRMGTGISASTDTAPGALSARPDAAG